MWSKFESCAGDDEEVHNIFTTSSIFKISSEEHVKIRPKVQAVVKNAKMVVKIDKTIVLLEKENEAVAGLLDFGAAIDFICISASGNLIICCLSDGCIHIIHIKGYPLFQKSIQEEDVDSPTFVQVSEVDGSFFLSCRNGSIYEIPSLEASVLSECVTMDDGTISVPPKTADNVKVKRIFQIKDFIKASSVVLTKEDLVGGNDKQLCFGRDHTKVKVPEVFQGVKKIYDLEEVMICLTNSGNLFQICPITSLFFPCFQDIDFLIEDMFVMGINNNGFTELSILTKSENSKQFIKILEYPSFKCNLELEIGSPSWLIDQPNNSINFYFLNGEKLSSENIPQQMSMKLVSESEPKERLKKLIHRGLLEEAKAFATQFDLCHQQIYEEEAKITLLEISRMSDNNMDLLESKFSELIEILKKVENKSILSKMRIIEMPSRKLLSLYLNEMAYLMRDLPEHKNDLLEIREQQLRLQTLHIVDPYECDMGWQKFVYHPCLLRVCTARFKTDIQTAALIWKRHSASIVADLREKDVMSILKAIPNNIEPFHVIQFLRHFVPVIVQMYPKIMPAVIEWCIQKTRSLQVSKLWPENGLEFSTKLAAIFDDISYLHSDVERQHSNCVEKLGNLVTALQHLTVLKTQYNLVFTFDNYIKDSISDTAFAILQKVQLNNIQSVVNDVLYPIFIKQGKTPSEAIINYIHFLVLHRNSLNTWLERAVLCVNLLHSEDERMQCSLLILKSAPVPWNDVLAPLIKYRTSSHPIAQEINTEYEIQVIKILRIKYGWAANTSDSNTRLIARILRVDLPEMMKDVKDLIRVVPEIQRSANFLICNELVTKGRIEEAIKFFTELDDENRSTCNDMIINIFSMVLNDRTMSDCHENLVEFLKCIGEQSKVTGRENDLRKIQNKYILNKKFGLSIQDDHIGDLNTRKEYFKQGFENCILQKIKKDINEIENVVQLIWSEIIELSRVLDLNLLHCVYYISKSIDYLHLSCILSHYVIEAIECNAGNVETFIDLAVLLICQEIKKYLNEQTDAMDKSFTIDPLPYPLAHKLLVMASKKSFLLQREILELLEWVQILHVSYSLDILTDVYGNSTSIAKICGNVKTYFCEKSLETSKSSARKRVNKRESISIFDEVCSSSKDSAAILTESTLNVLVKTLSYSILLVCLKLKPESGIFLRFNSHFAKFDKTVENSANLEFCKLLEELIKVKQNPSWYYIAELILCYQNHSKSKIIHQDFVTMQLRKYFKHAFMQKESLTPFVFINLLGMVMSTPSPSMLLDKLTDEVKFDSQKLNSLLLAEMYFTEVGDTAKVSVIKEKRLKLYYYSELCKEDSSFKLKSDIDKTTMNELIKNLKKRVLSIAILHNLSRDFQWDYQQLLVAQTIVILRQQEPVFDVKIDAFGKEELVMKSKVEEIKELCQPYIDEITNHDLLSSKLLVFVTEINYYFYEMYMAIVDILVSINSLPPEMDLWMNILTFLRHKSLSKRRPSQDETDWWLKSHSEVGVLPKIARYRLPFLPIIQKPLKEVLDNEVTLDNCEGWFTLVRLKTMIDDPSEQEIIKTQDYLCMTAVKRSISEYKSNALNEAKLSPRSARSFNDNDKWNLEPVNNAFLKSVLRLVKHITDESKKILLLYFVSNNAPEGADQVEACYECYQYAINNESILMKNEKSQDIMEKIKRKYPILKTQHLLHVYDMIEDHLLQLVENPRELIYALYHHEIVLKPEKPNINEICSEIAALRNLDFEEIQLSLLKKWLVFSNESHNETLEETFYEDIDANQSFGKDESNYKYVIRAQYILGSWDSEKAMTLLLGHIGSENMRSSNTNKQLQIFECFARLSNEKNRSYVDVLSQSEYILIKCVHDLKHLGYNFTPEKFSEYDKIVILKKIWQNHSDNAFAMEVIANICLGFDIFYQKVWNGVLKQMVNFSMTKELNSLVDLLSTKPELLYSDGLIKAWECVLKLPFKKANHARTFDQEEQLTKALFRIQSCPLANKINLLEIAEDCVRLERPHMAVILVAFTDSENQKAKIRRLLKPYISDELKTEVNGLEDYGILSIVVNYALKEIGL
ncbi:KNTC1 family protein [Megaselia abdita]